MSPRAPGSPPGDRPPPTWACALDANRIKVAATTVVEMRFRIAPSVCRGITRPVTFFACGTPTRWPSFSLPFARPRQQEATGERQRRQRLA